MMTPPMLAVSRLASSVATTVGVSAPTKALDTAGRKGNNLYASCIFSGVGAGLWSVGDRSRPLGSSLPFVVFPKGQSIPLGLPPEGLGAEIAKGSHRLPGFDGSDGLRMAGINP